MELLRTIARILQLVGIPAIVAHSKSDTFTFSAEAKACQESKRLVKFKPFRRKAITFLSTTSLFSYNEQTASLFVIAR